MENIICEIGCYKSRKRLLVQYCWLGAIAFFLSLAVALISILDAGQYFSVFGYSYAELPSSAQGGLYFFFAGLCFASFVISIYMRLSTKQVYPADAMELMKDISADDEEMLSVINRIKAQDRFPTLREYHLIESHIAKKRWFQSIETTANA